MADNTAKVPRNPVAIFSTEEDTLKPIATNRFNTNTAVIQAGTPADSLDEIITNSYKEGGFSQSTQGGNNAVILEDLQAPTVKISADVKHIYQNGIPEWSATDKFFLGSLVKAVNSEKVYYSLVNDNVNKPLTDTNAWRDFKQEELDRLDILETDVGTNKSTISRVAKACLSTGLTDANDTFDLNVVDGSTLEVKAIKEVYFEIVTAGDTALKSFVSQTVDLNTITPPQPTGIFTKWLQIDKFGNLEFMDSQESYDNSKCRLGRILLSSDAGNVTFAHNGTTQRDARPLPYLATISFYDRISNVLKIKGSIDPNTNMTIKTGGLNIIDECVNWRNKSSVHNLVIPETDPISFYYIDPSSFDISTPTTPVTDIIANEYYNNHTGSLQPVTGQKATIHSVLVTRFGTVIIQRPEEMFLSLTDAVNSMDIVKFTPVYPRGDSVEIARIAMRQNTNNLTSTDAVFRLYQGSSGGSVVSARDWKDDGVTSTEKGWSSQKITTNLNAVRNEYGHYPANPNLKPSVILDMNTYQHLSNGVYVLQGYNNGFPQIPDVYDNTKVILEYTKAFITDNIKIIATNLDTRERWIFIKEHGSGVQSWQPYIPPTPFILAHSKDELYTARSYRVDLPIAFNSTTSCYDLAHIRGGESFNIESGNTVYCEAAGRPDRFDTGVVSGDLGTPTQVAITGRNPHTYDILYTSSDGELLDTNKYRSCIDNPRWLTRHPENQFAHYFHIFYPSVNSLCKVVIGRYNNGNTSTDAITFTFDITLHIPKVCWGPGSYDSSSFIGAKDVRYPPFSSSI